MVKPRKLSREFKLSALSRMEAGEDVSALSRELKVRRKLLYEWRDTFRAGGPEALRGPGRPHKGSLLAEAKSAVGSCDELSAAKQRIGELERKVGQQALEADFFRQALRLLETSRRASTRPGGTASMPSSRLGRGGKAD